MLQEHEYIVFFDGVCTLCNSSVDFIVRNERANLLKIASLQSDYGQEVQKRYRRQGKDLPDSILFYAHGNVYERSEAIFRICSFLKWPYRMLGIGGIVPRQIADAIYAWVARNRYAWFGKKETCRIPSSEERAKFLG